MRRFKKNYWDILERAAHCKRSRTSMLERECLHYRECVLFAPRFNATISKTVVEKKRERKKWKNRERSSRDGGMAEGGWIKTFLFLLCFPVEQRRRLRGIVSRPLARLNRTEAEAVSREFPSPRVVSRQGFPPFPSREIIFLHGRKEGRTGQNRTGQDRTGQVRRVQRARLDRRRLSRNTATRRMENKGRKDGRGKRIEQTLYTA